MSGYCTPHLQDTRGPSATLSTSLQAFTLNGNKFLMKNVITQPLNCCDSDLSSIPFVAAVAVFL